MTTSQEYEDFDRAMDIILKADPKAVKQKMEDDARERAEARKAKRVSSGRDPG